MAQALTAENDHEFIDEYLLGTSRTFALAIPLLSLERRRQIGLSYLLFRVADSIEDAPEGEAAVKKELLAAMKNCLSTPNASNPQPSELPVLDSASLKGLWPERSPTGRLLSEFRRLMAIYSDLPASVSQVIGKALTSTISGMIHFIEASTNSPNQIQIQTLGQLRLYCYAVAGIVGEMLTDVFVCHHPSGVSSHNELRRLSVGFGEFLQLVNILKDSLADANCGRVFIPIEASRDSVYELAQQDREHALAYIRLLETSNFPADITCFCRFLYLLAEGSLEKLRQGGAGSKLSREEVLRILSEVQSQTLLSHGKIYHQRQQASELIL